MNDSAPKLTGRIGDPDSNDETYIVSVSPVTRMNQIFNRFLAQHMPFGFQSSVADMAYHPLPYKPASDDELLLREPWRVRLELYVREKRLYMGLELYGDVILGRGRSHPGRIILDLEPYGALEQGVSREHVILRPTRTRLFAIDRDSTNSTSVNGVHSGPGVATQLNDGDLLTLGNMVLMVHIVTRPDGTAAGDKKPAENADAKPSGTAPDAGKPKTAIQTGEDAADAEAAIVPEKTGSAAGQPAAKEAVKKPGD